jgi:prepilin-type processing-associated H-X9-DG protein/prepilin-type N-terminal cleavage/methylation domain-containing protein
MRGPNSGQRPGGCGGSGGFTLVELLVVIAIIAILIAILLPVLNRAREQANKVKCMANLHTLGIAMGQYVFQWQHYPGGITDANFSVWPARLRFYLGGDQHAFNCPSREPEYAWDGPRHGIRLGEGYGYRADEWSINLEPFSYGYNGPGTDIRSTGRGLGTDILWQGRRVCQQSAPEVKASRVRVPADMIAITDTGVFPVGRSCNHTLTIPYRWDPPNFNDPILYMNGPTPIHNGGTNVLFCDGHVQWYYTSDILIQDRDRVAAGNAPTTERDKRVARMWNRDHEP